jgi:riboflavin kinase/FMN adenylyltransferase
MGVDTTIVANFDQTLAQMPAEDFVCKILVGLLHLRCLTVGQNWRFGAGGRGDAALLDQMAREYDFTFCSCPSLEIDGVTVSSTLLRTLLAQGKVGEASQYLGRPYQLSGLVQTGDGRGRQLGFPTANLSLPIGRALPANGVYACWAGVGRLYPAVASIGVRPTFESQGVRRLEVHLLGRSLRLLGRQLRVAFIAQLRGERHFPSAEALTAQIAADCRDASAILLADAALPKLSGGS